MEITPRGNLRASDAEREHVAERLRSAAAEGRLASEELEERLEVALSARTYRELDSVIRDLPHADGAFAPRRRSRGLAIAGAGAGSALAVARARPILAVAMIIPVLVVTLAILTGVVAIWAIWWIVGWWMFGARRRAIAGRYGPAYGARARARAGSGGSRGMCGHGSSAGPRYWV
jgi:hypothetical protein